MNISLKRTLAAAMAVICTASMCGCADSGYIMTIDGVDIRNGIYLSGAVSAYSEAFNKVTEANTEEGDTAEVEDLFAETIEDKSASDWIKEEALNTVKRYVAIERLFEEHSLTLPEGEMDAVNADLNSVWDDENFYAQYIYGFNTMGEYYESIGISKDSMREIYTNQSKENEVFDYYYGENGVNAVPADELNTYLTENYASVKYLQLDYDDKFGLALKDEASIQAIKDTAQSYVDRLNNGEDYLDIQYDYDLKAAQNKASADAEDAYAELPDENLPDFDAYIQEAVDAATAERKDSADELDVVINKESSTLAEDITDFIWNTPADGKAYLFENDEASFVVVREDITTKDSWLDTNRVSVVGQIKGDEFETMLEETYSAYTVDLNDYLVNNKYAPEKLKGLE